MERERLRLPYDLRIGVTGHRKLVDPGEVERRVDQVLDHIAGALADPERAPLVWKVVSPLAVGADQIVATRVRQRSEETGEKSALEVITPFPLQLYREDFSPGEERNEFEKLLSQAGSVRELGKDAEVRLTAEERSQSYARVGEEVVGSCELLLAVWDGQAARGKGGTAEIVAYALDQGRTVIWIDPTDRDREPCLLGPGGQRRPLPTKAKALSPSYHQLCALVRDCEARWKMLDAALESERGKMLNAAGRLGLDPSSLEAILEHLLPWYARVDRLAIRYQKLHLVASRAIYLLSAIAVSVVAFQVIFFPEQLWLIAFEVASMLVAFACLAVSRRQAWHEKWIHDRYLAEHLRLGMYAALVLDPAESLDEAMAKLPFYQNPHNWLLSTFRGIARRARAEIPAGLPFEPVRRFIVEQWLRDQLRFHQSTALNRMRPHRRARRTVLVLFLAALVVAILHMLGLGHDPHAGAVLGPGHWAIFLAITLPAWGAALHAADRQLDHERIASRSRQMARELSKLCERAASCSEWAELEDVVRKSSATMAVESYEWLALLSFNRAEIS